MTRGHAAAAVAGRPFCSIGPPFFPLKKPIETERLPVRAVSACFLGAHPLCSVNLSTISVTPGCVAAGLSARWMGFEPRNPITISFSFERDGDKKA
jgi:hypothetical protein